MLNKSVGLIRERRKTYLARAFMMASLVDGSVMDSKMAKIGLRADSRTTI